MSHSAADPESLVRYLVESLVDSPEHVRIDAVDEGDTLRLEVTLDSEDVGKVIGRGGRIIKAIRTLARAAAGTGGRHVEVDIIG